MSEGVLVAQRVHGRCHICALPADQRREVNAALWDTNGRKRGYTVAGREVYEQLTGGTIGKSSIDRHLRHIERSMRVATEEAPRRATEEVIATDYETIMDTAARVGMKAMASLEDEMSTLGARERVALAKMGVTARAQQKAIEAEGKRPHVTLLGIIGLASGHLARLPESEAITVYEEGDLVDEVHAERRLLEERAGR